MHVMQQSLNLNKLKKFIIYFLETMMKLKNMNMANKFLWNFNEDKYPINKIGDLAP